MKRILIVLATAFIAISSVVASGGQEESSADSSETIKLSMFYAMDTTDKAQVERWDRLMARFNELHPNIEIEVEVLYSEAYHDKLMTMAVAKQLPDLMYLWPGKRTAFVTGAGLAEDISDRIEPYRDLFPEVALFPQGENGEIYELPETINVTHILYTNDKLLDELGLTFPETLDEMIAQGEVIRNAGYIPISMSNGDGWQMQSCFLSTLVERTGGMEYYDRLKTGDAKFNDPEFVEALEVIKRLHDADMFTPGINQAPYGQEINDFVNEKAVYMIDGAWRVNNLTTELTEEEKEYISLRTIPRIPGQKGQDNSTSAVAAYGFGMKSGLEKAKADAAWEWIWFFSGPEGSKIRQEVGAVPACKLDVEAELDPMVVKLKDFMATSPGAYVLDSIFDQEGMGLLSSGMQEVMLGSKTALELANEYEAWAALNDSSRK